MNVVKLINGHSWLALTGEIHGEIYVRLELEKMRILRIIVDNIVNNMNEFNVELSLKALFSALEQENDVELIIGCCAYLIRNEFKSESWYSRRVLDFVCEKQPHFNVNTTYQLLPSFSNQFNVEKSFSALRQAIDMPSLFGVEYLMEREDIIENEDEIPILHFAYDLVRIYSFNYGNTRKRIFEILLQSNKFDIHTNDAHTGENILFYLKDNYGLYESFVHEHNVNVNHQSLRGVTPIMRRDYNGQCDLARIDLLLRYGANPWLTDNCGYLAITSRLFNRLRLKASVNRLLRAMMPRWLPARSSLKLSIYFALFENDLIGLRMSDWSTSTHYDKIPRVIHINSRASLNYIFNLFSSSSNKDLLRRLS